MSKVKKLKPIPEFRSEKEEAEFWDTHDSTEYIDWDKAETLEPHSFPKSPRCPHHKSQVLYTRWRTLVIANGFASLNKVRELYCLRGDYTRLAPETAALVKKAEAALKRVQPKLEKFANA
jgi:hypothetical protein